MTCVRGSTLLLLLLLLMVVVVAAAEAPLALEESRRVSMTTKSQVGRASLPPGHGTRRAEAEGQRPRLVVPAPSRVVIRRPRARRLRLGTKRVVPHQRRRPGSRTG